MRRQDNGALVVRKEDWGIEVRTVEAEGQTSEVHSHSRSVGYGLTYFNQCIITER